MRQNQRVQPNVYTFFFKRNIKSLAWRPLCSTPIRGRVEGPSGAAALPSRWNSPAFYGFSSCISARFMVYVVFDISDERENNGPTPPREDRPPAESQSAEAPFGSPGSCCGDTAVRPPLPGRRARAENPCESGWYRGRVAFRPKVWGGGFFFFQTTAK